MTARLRAVALAIVWSLPGMWCTDHVLAHSLELRHHGAEAVVSADECVTGVTEDHRHGHDHPQSSPAVAPDGSKKIDALAIFATSVELGSSRTILRHAGHAVGVGHKARLALAASGPRAPPTS